MIWTRIKCFIGIHWWLFDTDDIIDAHARPGEAIPIRRICGFCKKREN